jgi:hypothetical protein
MGELFGLHHVGTHCWVMEYTPHKATLMTYEDAYVGRAWHSKGESPCVVKKGHERVGFCGVGGLGRHGPEHQKGV